MMRRSRTVVFAVLAAFLGCGSEDGNVKLVPVKGTVTKNGKPMAGATISFVPEAANPVSTPGNDATGPEGSYSIRWRNRSGLAPGKYKVFVEPAIEITGKVPEAFKDDPYMAKLAMGPAAGKKKDLGEKSEFDAVVEENGDNKFEFDVKAKEAK